MNQRWLRERIAYDGSQLRAHWILGKTGLVGDSVVAFRGSCRVVDGEMADLEDLLSHSEIAADDMVHCLIEVFDDGDIMRAVYLQRLVSAVALDTLRTLASGADIYRRGDDLFAGDGKLSISVATRSMVSSLIHFAVNVSNLGTPVRTAGLEDLGVEPEAFANALLGANADEYRSVLAARAQVRAKGEARP